MYAFDYHRPQTLAEAVGLLAGKEDGRFLAGGQSLLPAMKQRVSQVSDLVDIGRIAELRLIRREGDALIIGAATTHAEVHTSEEVAAHCAALAELAGMIGDPHVRHKGTIGGSVANHDPAGDYPAACLALGAVIITDRREIPADEFFTGLFDTALEEGELITAVRFPVVAKSAYVKFAQPASRYALVGVFAGETASGLRLAVTGAGNDGVFRFTEGEEALGGQWNASALASVKPSEDAMVSDMHGDAAYRAHLVQALAQQAVEKAG